MNDFQSALKRAFKKHSGAITQDICSKHNCNKIVVNGNEICPQCKKEQDAINITKDFYKNEKASKKRIHDKILAEFLTNKSIMPNNLKNSLLDMSFSNYYPNTQEQTKNLHMAKNLAQEYNNGAVGNAFIQGKVGRGKTHLAMSILEEFDGKALFVSLHDMFNLIQGGYNTTDRYYPYTVDYFTNLFDQADLVVFDDLGTESSLKDGHVNSGNANKLRGMYEHCKRVITTTNLEPVEVAGAYGKLVQSKVFEGLKNSENRVIRFTDGNDYRLGGHAS